MALPTTISSVIMSDQNYFHGPWIDGNGNVYTLLLTSTTPRPAIHKATDPTASFSEQDSADRPSAYSNYSDCCWANQRSDVLHICNANRISPTELHVLYHTFNTSDNGSTPDNWAITDEEIESVADASAASEISCSIAVRSDGTVVVLYNGDEDQVKGTKYARVDYNIRSAAGVWGGPVGASPNGKNAIDYFGSVIVLDTDNDMCHFFWKDASAVDIDHASLSAADSLSGIQPVDQSVSSDNHPFGPGIYVLDGSNHRVTVPYIDSDGTISMAHVVDDGTPTVTTGVGDAAVYVANGSPAACLAKDGTDAWLLQSRSSDQDLYSDTAVTPHTGWTTDVEREDAVTINRVSGNSYTRSGSKVLAWVEDNGGTIRYNELTLSAPDDGNAQPFQWANESPGAFTRRLLTLAYCLN